MVATVLLSHSRAQSGEPWVDLALGPERWAVSLLDGTLGSHARRTFVEDKSVRSFALDRFKSAAHALLNSTALIRNYSDSIPDSDGQFLLGATMSVRPSYFSLLGWILRHKQMIPQPR
jgi:hypothetical protein